MHFDDIVILYASQTGTAEDVSRHMFRQLSTCYKNGRVQLFSCDEYLGEKKDDTDGHCLVLIVCSTTGNGDPPENSRFFWRYVMSRRFDPATLFGTRKSIHYAILGLGDSSYERFNFTFTQLYHSENLNQV